MSATPATTTDDALAALVRGQNRDPFAVLGPHPGPGGGIVIRAFQPAARSIDVRLPGGRPVFPEVPVRTPEEVLAAHGLVPDPPQTLDPQASLTLVSWRRSL